MVGAVRRPESVLFQIPTGEAPLSQLHTTPLGAVRGMRSAQQKHERASTVRPIVRSLLSLIATITNDYHYTAVCISILYFRQICMDLSKQCWLIFLGNLWAHCSLKISLPESEKIIRLVSFNTKRNLKYSIIENNKIFLSIHFLIYARSFK